MSVLDKDYTLTENGSTDPQNVPLSTDYMVYVAGDMGAGSLELQTSPNNGVDWFTIFTILGKSRLIIYLVSGEKIRFNLSGSVNPNIRAGFRE
jgi:hypothetical protein